MIESGILPLLVVIMPMHPLAIAAFLVIMTAMNVLGHLGYKLYRAVSPGTGCWA